jgi:tetratricopeptide (TPR) repeat protein
MGNALARLGDSEGAVRAYRKAIEQRKGRYSRALNNLAVVRLRQGHWQQAHDALTGALRLESFRYAEASYNLGRLYATQGEMDLAIREWRRAIYVDPGHTAAAQAIARAGDEERIKVASKAQPDKAEAKGPTAGSRTTAGNVISPSPTFSSSRVLTIDRETYNQLQRARNARERGKDQEAVASYRNVISRMGGYFVPANLELSYVLIGLKQTSEARVYLREVTTRDGARYPISYYHLARIYEFNGELELAAEAYGQAARHYADVNPQFLLDISRVREKLGDYNGALSAMQEYLTAMERQGTKPDWSEERLASLRQKLAASQLK